MSKKKRRLLQLQRQAQTDGRAGLNPGGQPTVIAHPATTPGSINQDTTSTAGSAWRLPVNELDALRQEAASVAPDDVEIAPEADPPPATVDTKRLWDQLVLAKRQFEASRDEAKKALEKADHRERAAKGVLAREREVLTRERDLRERELNAEHGFLTENRNAIATLDNEVNQKRTELAELNQLIAEERENLRTRRLATELEWQEEWERKQALVDSELAATRAAVEAAQRIAKERLAETEVREQAIREREQLIDRLVAARSDERLGSTKAELAAAQVTATSYLERLLVLEARLRDLHQVDRKIDGQSPERLLQERDRLSAKIRELEDDLDNRLPLTAGEELIRLQVERASWLKREGDLLGELRGLKDKLFQSNEQAWDAERHRSEVTILEQQRRVLEERIAGLRKTIDDHLKAADGGTPFKECSAMDTKSEFQVEPQRQILKQGLPRLVEYVRHRMATPSEEYGELYYTERDIRSFVGGMAMSRLILLQGISGIGKTSLPRAIARVLGGASRVIPVQAGWRDRYDLMGHYNSFEGRYRESAFLQALYAAGTPAFRDGLFFIVLDEVNLSRPEQYFADCLSALELGEHERYLEVMDSPVPNAPALLQDGRRLAIPRNVWFVGTANQDETTQQFADKTIDRSHVLELPSAPVPFTPKAEKVLSKGISLSRLLELFNEAASRHSLTSDNVHALFFDTLREHLANPFGIGLSGRLGSQLERYVGTVVEAGGTASEAADHLLATRLLRGVKDRHDLRAPELQKFETTLAEEWRVLDAKREPVESLRLIRNEIRRLQTGVR